jgi:hypothetical protein
MKYKNCGNLWWMPRSKFDIAIIDAYWDQDGNGLCPAATD